MADLTYVRAHTGWTYVTFILDVFSRMIVGWQVSNRLRPTSPWMPSIWGYGPANALGRT